MKKGFTLIELLAVIVILAVITLIAVPVVSGIITKVRLNALKSSAYGLMEASDLYHAHYSNDKSVRFDIDKNKVSSNDTDKLLTYNGEVKEGTVIINKKGETTICLTDGKNSVYKNFRDKQVIEVANKKCNIPSSTYVVYLDNTATLNELSNQELTELVRSMQEEINTLKQEKANQSDLELVSTAKATVNDIYPVGSIYITYTEDTVSKVQAKFGGTWVKIKDTFLLSDGDTYKAGNIGGSATNSHTHSVTASGTVGSTTLTTAQIPSHRHSIPSLSGIASSTGSAHKHTIYTARQYDTGPSSDGSYKIGRTLSNADGVEVYNTGFNQSNTSGVAEGAHSHSVTTTASNTEYLGGSGSHNHTFTGSAVTSGTASDTNNMPPYLVVYMYKRTS